MVQKGLLAAAIASFIIFAATVLVPLLGTLTPEPAAVNPPMPDPAPEPPAVNPPVLDSAPEPPTIDTSIPDPAPEPATIDPPVPGSEPATQCTGSASCFSGAVTRIVDGDTIDVNDVRIRLALANTPERGETGYGEAAAFTAGLCPVGSTALVDEDDGQTSGSYGRMVAKVFCGGRNLNADLLEAGHATILATYCSESEFAGEEWAVRHGC